MPLQVTNGERRSGLSRSAAATSRCRQSATARRSCSSSLAFAYGTSPFTTAAGSSALTEVMLGAYLGKRLGAPFGQIWLSSLLRRGTPALPRRGFSALRAGRAGVQGVDGSEQRRRVHGLD